MLIFLIGVLSGAVLLALVGIGMDVYDGLRAERAWRRRVRKLE